ncbi:MAG: DUF484 family protein [Colwellia sp.]
MSIKNIPSSGLDDLPLNDELVLTYLQDNPEFFNRNPNLVTNLRLEDQQRGTVSLVQRQQQQLRQKVTVLEDEITQLMSVGNHNDQLFTLFSDLYLKLIDCESVNSLLDYLTYSVTELLSLSVFKIWIDPSYTDTAIEHTCVSENDCGGILQNRLANEDYYFGRLQQTEQSLIFTRVCAGSVALIKLSHENKTFGFLTIFSEDAQHFDPRMDTMLLSQFRKLVSKLLYKQLTSA